MIDFLFKLFDNLLVNAIQAVKDNPEHQRDIRLSLGILYDHIVFEIIDNGVGIPEENLNDLIVNLDYQKRI